MCASLPLDPKKGKTALMKCTIFVFKWQLLAAVPPKLLNIAFTYAQPLLINTVIDFIGDKAPGETRG